MVGIHFQIVIGNCPTDKFAVQIIMRTIDITYAGIGIGITVGTSAKRAIIPKKWIILMRSEK